MHHFLPPIFCLLLLAFAAKTAQAKSGSNLFPESARENARRNLERYGWAKAECDRAIEAARPFVALSDRFLWEWVPEQTISRSHQVNQRKVCPNCGPKQPADGGPKFVSDPIQNPWRITCATCGEVFPKNDFAAFYASGKDEHFLFDPGRADRSLLVSSDHPDPADPKHRFQVDDGLGWKARDGEKYFFIGFCGEHIWSKILEGLRALSTAYLLTGDPQYAHKAAVLLDRIADVYPAMDWKPWHRLGHYQSHGGFGNGKLFGRIWETNVAKTLATAYDAIYPGMDGDEELVRFLSSRAAEHQLPGDKGSLAGIRRHIEDGILREIGNGILSGSIRGNQGMHQSAMAVTALVLDEPETSEEWIRWIFRTDPDPAHMYDAPATGANLLKMLVSQVDRDGMGNEASPSYNSIWPNGYLEVAEVLERSERYRSLSPLRENTRLRRMFHTPVQLLCLGKYVPPIGDSGRTGAPSRSGLSLETYLRAYQLWKDPQLARIAYLLNGDTADGLHGDIYQAEPEQLAKEIRQVVESAGPLKLESVNLDGYGFAALRSGEGDLARDLWLYYGRSSGHGHLDALNLGIHAFGVDLAPDLGYPEHTGPWPKRMGWTSNTISHNTVVVNRRKQDSSWIGKLHLFSVGPQYKIVELSAEKSYRETRLYRRTSALIDLSPTDSYIVDLFRIVGGEDHRWSFHSADGLVTTEGLALLPQGQGTYAGEDVAFGSPYDGDLTWGYPGSGFQYLYNVRRDPAPGDVCSVEWRVRDTWKVWERPRDVRLRVTLVNPPGEVSLAHGDPPQNKHGNPRRLTYLLVGGSPGRRDTSTFISVIEPYESKRKIRRITRVPIEPSTEPFFRLQAVALKIECADGRFDYVMSALDGKTERMVDGAIRFAGRFGVLSVKDGKCVGAQLVGGNLLAGFGAELTLPVGEWASIIRAMSREPEQPSWIETDATLPDDGSLVGKWILIEPDGPRDAAYRIEAVRKLDAGTRIELGNVSLARDMQETADGEVRYLYDFKEGARFTIPLDARLA